MMGTCWWRGRAEGAQCTDGSSAASPQSHRCPHKAFWLGLSACLLLIVVALGLTGHLRLSQLRSKVQSSQIVRFTIPDQAGFLINQSAVVDLQNHLVTFSVVSAANTTSTVLFDLKQGLVCYQPSEQEGCFLRKMDNSDYEHVHTLLGESLQKQNHFLLPGNETQRQTEFVGVLTDSQVDVSLLDAPLQSLCEDRTVHWARRVEGPNKLRLVYFCIDICFPSNICVSVCFYYLPE